MRKASEIETKIPRPPISVAKTVPRDVWVQVAVATAIWALDAVLLIEQEEKEDDTSAAFALLDYWVGKGRNTEELEECINLFADGITVLINQGMCDDDTYQRYQRTSKMLSCIEAHDYCEAHPIDTSDLES